MLMRAVLRAQRRLRDTADLAATVTDILNHTEEEPGILTAGERAPWRAKEEKKARVASVSNH